MTTGNGEYATLTLEDITGQESGVVVYDDEYEDAEVIICNWSSVHGFPRIDPWGCGIMGLGEELAANGETYVDDIMGDMPAGQLMWDRNGDYDGLRGHPGKRYTVTSGATTATVYAPAGWH